MRSRCQGGLNKASLRADMRGKGKDSTSYIARPVTTYCTISFRYLVLPRLGARLIADPKPKAGRFPDRLTEL